MIQSHSVFQFYSRCSPPPSFTQQTNGSAITYQVLHVKSLISEKPHKRSGISILFRFSTLKKCAQDPSVSAGVTKAKRQIGSLHSRRLFSHSSRGQKSSTRFGFLNLLGLQVAAVSLCPHLVFPLCKEPQCLGVQISSSKDTSRTD